MRSTTTRNTVMCPACGGMTVVLETRGAQRNTVRRRRGCARCDARWITCEVVVAQARARTKFKPVPPQRAAALLRGDPDPELPDTSEAPPCSRPE